eukprot:g4919.t1
MRTRWLRKIQLLVAEDDENRRSELLTQDNLTSAAAGVGAMGTTTGVGGPAIPGDDGALVFSSAGGGVASTSNTPRANADGSASPLLGEIDGAPGTQSGFPTEMIIGAGLRETVFLQQPGDFAVDAMTPGAAGSAANNSFQQKMLPPQLPPRDIYAANRGGVMSFTNANGTAFVATLPAAGLSVSSPNFGPIKSLPGEQHLHPSKLSLASPSAASSTSGGPHINTNYFRRQHTYNDGTTASICNPRHIAAVEEEQNVAFLAAWRAKSPLEKRCTWDAFVGDAARYSSVPEMREVVKIAFDKYARDRGRWMFGEKKRKILIVDEAEVCPQLLYALSLMSAGEKGALHDPAMVGTKKRRLIWILQSRLKLVSQVFQTLGEALNVDTVNKTHKFLDYDKDGVVSRKDVQDVLSRSKDPNSRNGSEPLFRGRGSQFSKEDLKEVEEIFVKHSILLHSASTAILTSGDDEVEAAPAAVLDQLQHSVSSTTSQQQQQRASSGPGAAARQNNKQTQLLQRENQVDKPKTQLDFKDLFLHVNAWMSHCDEWNSRLFLDELDVRIRAYVLHKRRHHAGLALGSIRDPDRESQRSRDEHLQRVLELIGESKLLYQSSVQYLTTFDGHRDAAGRIHVAATSSSTGGAAGGAAAGAAQPNRATGEGRGKLLQQRQQGAVVDPFDIWCPQVDMDFEPYLSTLRSGLLLSYIDAGHLRPSIEGKWTVEFGAACDYFTKKVEAQSAQYAGAAQHQTTPAPAAARSSGGAQAKGDAHATGKKQNNFENDRESPDFLRGLRPPNWRSFTMLLDREGKGRADVMSGPGENDWTKADVEKLVPNPGLKVRCRNPNFHQGKWREFIVDTQKALQEVKKFTHIEYKPTVYDFYFFEQVAVPANMSGTKAAAGASAGGSSNRAGSAAAGAAMNLFPKYPNVSDMHLTCEMHENQKFMHGYWRLNAPRLNLMATHQSGQGLAFRKSFGSFVDAKKEVWDEQSVLIEFLDPVAAAATCSTTISAEQELCAILKGQLMAPARSGGASYENRLSQVAFVLSDPNVGLSLTRGLTSAREWVESKTWTMLTSAALRRAAVDHLSPNKTAPRVAAYSRTPPGDVSGAGGTRGGFLEGEMSRRDNPNDSHNKRRKLNGSGDFSAGVARHDGFGRPDADADPAGASSGAVEEKKQEHPAGPVELLSLGLLWLAAHTSYIFDVRARNAAAPPFSHFFHLEPMSKELLRLPEHIFGSWQLPRKLFQCGAVVSARSGAPDVASLLQQAMFALRHIWGGDHASLEATLSTLRERIRLSVNAAGSTGSTRRSSFLHHAMRLLVDVIINVCGSEQRNRKFNAEVRRLVLDLLCEYLAPIDTWVNFKCLDLLHRMFTNRERVAIKGGSAGSTWARKKDADYLQLIARKGRIADALNFDGYVHFRRLFEYVVAEYDKQTGYDFMREEWYACEFHERAP